MHYSAWTKPKIALFCTCDNFPQVHQVHQCSRPSGNRIQWHKVGELFWHLTGSVVHHPCRWAKGAAVSWGQRKWATDSDFSLVSTTFAFVPALTELLKPEPRWLRDFIMCRGSQIHTERTNMPSGGATPTLAIYVHSCFFFYASFFPCPCKWGYSFAPSMSAAALAPEEPRALWTLPFGKKKRKPKV